MTKSIGPEVLAAAAEKHGVNSKYANMAAKGASKAGLKVRVPSLKELVTKPGAVAGMLKAIMNFLKLRFPAFLGMNVLYSLALFGRLFHSLIFLCHTASGSSRCEMHSLIGVHSPSIRLLVLPQARQRSSSRKRAAANGSGDCCSG